MTQHNQQLDNILVAKSSSNPACKSSNSAEMLPRTQSKRYARGRASEGDMCEDPESKHL